MHPKKNAFTMIELMVTISIIAFLAGLTLALVNIARNKSAIAVTESIMNQINIGLAKYKEDFDDYPWVDVMFQDHNDDSSCRATAFIHGKQINSNNLVLYADYIRGQVDEDAYMKWLDASGDGSKQAAHEGATWITEADYLAGTFTLESPPTGYTNPDYFDPDGDDPLGTYYYVYTGPSGYKIHDNSVNDVDFSVAQPHGNVIMNDTEIEGTDAIHDYWGKPIMYFHFLDPTSMAAWAGTGNPGYPGPVSGFEKGYELWSMGPDSDFQDFIASSEDDVDADNIAGTKVPPR